MQDPILDEMALELREALIVRGLDPKDPPSGGPPSEAAFGEYQRRGGVLYAKPDEMVAALVAKVGE